MRICIVNPDFKLGGQQKAALMLGNQFLKEKHELIFYSFFTAEPFFDVKDLNIIIDQTKENQSVMAKIKRKLLRKTFFKSGKADPTIEFAKRHQRLLDYLLSQSIDLVILNGGFLTTFSQSIKAFIPTIKVIAWQHSSAQIYLEKYYLEIKKSYIKGLAASDAVVCLTKEDRAIFSSYNSRTVNIANAVTLPKENLVSEPIGQSLVFVARFDIETKGIDYLVEVIKLLPEEVVVNFAGSGTVRQEHKIKKLICKNKLVHRVNFLGALGEEELAKLYRNGQIFLSTSRWEGFGLSIIEAMSFGLPVISFDTSGAREILGENEFGIIIKNFDTKEMAKMITIVLNDPHLRRTLSERAKKRAQDFEPQKIKQEWEQLIEEIIK